MTWHTNEERKVRKMTELEIVMSKIKRYDHYFQRDEMGEEADGCYVTYEDHAELVGKLSLQLEEARNLARTLKQKLPDGDGVLFLPSWFHKGQDS